MNATNTRAQPILLYLATIFNEKGCLQAWGGNALMQ